MNDSLLAEELIAELCRRVARGKAATREIRGWLGNAKVTEIEFRLLWLLRTASAVDLTQKQLATRLAVSTGQVSAVVERLRGHQWIEPWTPPEDRRRQCWQLTTLGQQVVSDIVGQVTERMTSPPREAA